MFNLKDMSRQGDLIKLVAGESTVAAAVMASTMASAWPLVTLAARSLLTTSRVAQVRHSCC